MIIQDIYIKRVGWHVRVYHAVDTMYADEIIDELIKVGCRGEMLTNAKISIWRGMLNSGMTYSNTKAKESLMVIGLTTRGAEYWNTLEHEMQHLLQDIELSLGLDHYGEEIAYVSGEFIRDLYPKAKHLLCDCCRNSYKNVRARLNKALAD